MTLPKGAQVTTNRVLVTAESGDSLSPIPHQAPCRGTRATVCVKTHMGPYFVLKQFPSPEVILGKALICIVGVV